MPVSIDEFGYFFLTRCFLARVSGLLSLFLGLIAFPIVLQAYQVVSVPTLLWLEWSIARDRRPLFDHRGVLAAILACSWIGLWLAWAIHLGFWVFFDPLGA